MSFDMLSETEIRTKYERLMDEAREVYAKDCGTITASDHNASMAVMSNDMVAELRAVGVLDDESEADKDICELLDGDVTPESNRSLLMCLAERVGLIGTQDVVG